ncbi:C-GCAxxG-C-C family (seleno)protein [Desulfitobacterium sp.]|uniref:C-GCAxxG-C-C family (seleno)protein n=1 Tax=Desulfitobacterium sp. TaxID=49981 RepID=UPI002CBE852B|nr:C-GCAxxG-C-C family (seleno)protein [Desulfitobacterium sp.]HVJ50133.1 C-GCAxxG-C-C family (seleno)protein [Desulfitobacterium sp.]
MSLEGKNFDRRNFLKSIGFLAAGAAVSSGIVGILDPKSVQAAAPALPWPYAPLDTTVIRQRAYQNYYTGGCMYASAKALMDTLYDTAGTPWDTLPVDMFKYGKGGAFNWGTLCGALNGSLYVMNLAAGTAVDPLGNELIGWYTTNPFPSNLMDSYANYKRVRQTVSNSPLCHLSVSNWCYTTKNTVSSDQKKDRCAKVAADTAAKAAEILKSWKAGTFVGVYQPGAEFSSCLSCHNGATSQRDDEQGLANCTMCHVDKITNHPL